MCFYFRFQLTSTKNTVIHPVYAIIITMIALIRVFNSTPTILKCVHLLRPLTALTINMALLLDRSGLLNVLYGLFDITQYILLAFIQCLKVMIYFVFTKERLLLHCVLVSIHHRASV